MRDINWNALGVPDQKLVQRPTVRDFPSGLNSAASKYWGQALSSVSATGSRAWAQALKNFIGICGTAGVYPFDTSGQNNDIIYSELIRARREVIRFIETHGINKEMVVRTTERRVTATQTGFVLECIGHCDSMATPPSAIARMGIRTARGRWATQWNVGLGKNTTFYIANDLIQMTGRWHYGYVVDIPMFPSIPGNGAPTSKEIEAFILKVIYLPILRAYRPLGLMHRLV